VKRAHPLLSALTLLTLCTLAQAAGTPAGTVISNQATADGDLLTEAGSTPVSGLSNRVITTVSAVCSVSVLPDGSVAAPGQQQTILPGERALFAYQVTNTGNAESTIPLSLLVPTESAFQPTLTLYLDANGDGKLDPAEETPINSVKLLPDGVAKLLVGAQTSAGQTGDAFVNLVAGCAAQTGSDDSNNVALLRLGAPPALTVTKTFSPAFLKPGSETTVSLSTTNAGKGASREVILADELASLRAQGLNYVPGSAVISSGTLESGSGNTWQAGDSAGLQGLRVRLASLKPGESLSLSFKMVATVGTENLTLSNTAVATTAGQSVQSVATLVSRYSPQVALGPVGVPDAAEGSEADRQTKAFGLVGRPVCFTQTVKNTGDVADTFTFSAEVVGSSGTPAAVSFQSVDGQPLQQPLTLAEGESRDIRVCAVPSQTGLLTVRLLASGARGSSNATTDQVTLVQSGLPDVLKAVSPAGLVSGGTTLSYSLTVRNTYSVPLTNLVVRDPLGSALSFESGSDGAVFRDGAVVWTLPSLAPGESRTLTFKASVKAETADGTDVTNTFTISSSELPEPVPSNETSSPVWTSKLVIEKLVDKPNVTYGDRLTYTLKIRNLSAKAPLIDGVVTDSPASGLEYIPGTSTLAGAPIADPTIVSGTLSWKVATLPPGSDVIVTYQLRVTTRSSGTLPNSVIVSGKASAGQQTTAIASNRATRTVRLQLLTFAPLSEIVGMVYIDRNRDGRFQPELDQPLERARVLLAGGREALTDAAGRYHFKDVPQGEQALRLDPASVPSPALSLPMDGGLSGTRSLLLTNLSAVDFPLAPLTGEIQALRSLNLVAGPLSLSKSVSVSNQSYTVTIRLKADSALPDFVLSDPLPVGAVLKEGRNTLSTTLSAGETTLTYRFDWAGERRAAVTEPALRWRY
jgi:uncharacterized repeat protein (TIGR01451 family)